MINSFLTPLIKLRHGARTFFLKDETKQIGGSFKFRGPDRFFALNPDVKSVVTASSGNHAIGVSTAAKLHDASACIYIPENTPATKVAKIEAAGGEIHRIAGSYEDALAAAVAHANTSDDTLLPSYDHPTIIEGNRSLYREAVEQSGQTFSRIAVPVGGGGCVSAAILEGAASHAEIIAGEYAPFERIQKIALDSQSGDIDTDYVAEPSLEGIAIKTLGVSNRRILSESQNLQTCSVTYDDLLNACRLLKDECGIVAELGACAGFAAALKSPNPKQEPTLCIITGGNIDAKVHASIMSQTTPKIVRSESEHPMWSPLVFDRPEYAIARKSGPVFPYQFILSKTPVRHDENFNELQFADWTLYCGEKLDCSLAKKGSIEAMVLGVAVDSDGHVVTEERLVEIIERYKTLPKIVEYLVMCGGRYLFCISNGREQRLYLDPAGMFSAVYNAQEGVIASTATLAVSSPLQPNHAYPLWEVAAYPRGGRFAFENTLDVRGTQISANTYLNMNAWTTHRHWPHKDQDFSCTSMDDVNASVDITHKRHSQIIGALAAHRPVALPVTGGQDSRLLLAFSKPHIDKIKLFYSHVTNFNTQVDATTAAELCARIGAPHETFQIQGNIKKYRPKLPLRDLRRRYLIRRGYLVDDSDLQLTPLLKRELSAFSAVPEGHLVLRGHVTDICKAVLWRRIGITWSEQNPLEAIPADRGVSLMQLSPKTFGSVNAEYFQPAYEAWKNGLPQNAAGRSIDLMGLEQYRPYGLGLTFHGHEDNFYMAPGNDRQIIAALAKVSPKMRAHLHLNDLLLKSAAPELNDVSYVRGKDNELRNTRNPIKTYLEPTSLAAKSPLMA
jgi:threonine dehydratase